jgi:hypothetical protein
LAGSTVVKKRLRDPARMQLRAMAIALLQTDLLFDFSLDTSYDKDIRYYADRFRARQRARREFDARRAGMKILRDLKLEAQP